MEQKLTGAGIEHAEGDKNYRSRAVGFDDETCGGPGTVRESSNAPACGLGRHAGGLALHSTFAVEVPNHNDARLGGAIDRAVRQIESEAGLRHAIDGVVPTTRLVVKVSGPGEAVQSVNEDESY